MKEELKKFLTGELGFSEGFIKEMTSEEFSEDFDLENTISTWRENQKSIWLKKLDPDINEIFDKKFDVKQIKLAKQVAKQVGIEKTDREIKELGFDGLVKLVSPHIDERVSTASKGTDETLRTELETWKTQATKWKNDYSELENSSKSQLQKVRDEVEEEKHMSKVKTLFQEEFGKINYGISAEQKPLFEKEAMSRILGSYKINTEDRTITDKEGGQAVNFDKTAVYTHLSEPILYLAGKYNVLKRSNGGGGEIPPGGPAGDEIIIEDLSEDAKSLYDRAKAAKS